MGYSMGSRLLLSLVKGAPELWDFSLFISCHPGLEDAEAIDKRLAQDQTWRERLQALEASKAAEAFLRDWQSQSVFSNDPKHELFVDLIEHAPTCDQAMELFSLAKQVSYWDFLVEQSPKGLWVTGALDEKFSALARELKKRMKTKKSPLQFIEFEGVGHRIKGAEALLAKQFARELAGLIE